MEPKHENVNMGGRISILLNAHQTYLQPRSGKSYDRLSHDSQLYLVQQRASSVLNSDLICNTES